MAQKPNCSQVQKREDSTARAHDSWHDDWGLKPLHGVPECAPSQGTSHTVPNKGHRYTQICSLAEGISFSRGRAGPSLNKGARVSKRRKIFDLLSAKIEESMAMSRPNQDKNKMASLSKGGVGGQIW